MFQEHRVLSWDAHAQVRFRPDVVQLGLFEELVVFGFQDQLIGFDIGGQGDVAMHLGDISLDVYYAHLACHRNPVVSIPYEIDFADLVDLDRRQPDQSRRCHAHARPPLGLDVPAGQKITGEVGITPHAADDCIQGNIADAALGASMQLQLLADFIVRKQLVRFYLSGGRAVSFKSARLRARWKSLMALLISSIFPSKIIALFYPYSGIGSKIN